MIAGFDISTSTLGYTILDDDGKIIKMSYLDLKKTKEFFDCVDKFAELCDELKKEYDITSIIVEAPKKNFAHGKTSADTIVLLLRFNGVCCYDIRQKFGILPIMMTEGEARTLCGIKLKNSILNAKGKKVPYKEQAFNQMIQRPQFANWPWVMKKTGRFKDYHLDEMDSYIITFATFLKNSNKIK